MHENVTPIARRKAGERQARGFSVGELRKASLNVGEARRLGIPVDTRRKTAHEDNVERLRAYLKEAAKAS